MTELFLHQTPQGPSFITFRDPSGETRFLPEVTRRKRDKWTVDNCPEQLHDKVRAYTVHSGIPRQTPEEILEEFKAKYPDVEAWLERINKS